ncbi:MULTISPECIES: hypothetical protein [Deinococcus]|uniref:Uncharacterized protein n=1 Tax=Deinococcus rufus TaxID=2136097 RepID=A0ABV7ZE66_9DEIO|nr:hypothetical protein [Deinococcus sp. AB2017081]WQE96664.1 hypothetical protein U2P90_07115 [Deinococcus sp. AB2017081]
MGAVTGLDAARIRLAWAVVDWAESPCGQIAVGRWGVEDAAQASNSRGTPLSASATLGFIMVHVYRAALMNR